MFTNDLRPVNHVGVVAGCGFRKWMGFCKDYIIQSLLIYLNIKIPTCRPKGCFCLIISLRSRPDERKSVPHIILRVLTESTNSQHLLFFETQTNKDNVDD